MIRLSPLSVLILSPFRRRRARALVLGAALLGASSAMAAPPQAADDEQGPASVSRPVVEPTAPSAGKALNAALGHLARDPRNVEALLQAGNAALALGDNEAALGFFTRADQVSPANATVKAAIAGARLHLDDPVEALRWYADAEKTGADASTFALDRGLAFDLVGDNTASIAQYRLVLARSRDPALRDEATRREALSLAIGGDRRGADLALLPLLQRQDRAAWRAHIFVLAIGGRGDDAVNVAHATMPPDLAESIAPYLRFMVRLTPAQQAAVASLGRFPRAADIGRDDSRVVAYSATHPRVPLVVAAPVLARALPTAADAKAARRRHGQTVVMAAAPAALPDIALPAPPPPVMLAANTGPIPAPSAGHAPVLVARIAPVAPVASRNTSPRQSAFDLAQATGSARARTSAAAAISPRVPQPAVLSRLDMPPPPHRIAAAPITTPDAPTPPISTQFFPTPAILAQLHPAQPHPAQALAVAAARAPLPAPVMVSMPVVEATPRAALVPMLAPATALAQMPVAPSGPMSAPAPVPVVPTPVPATAPPTQVAVASPPAAFAPAIPEPTPSVPGTHAPVAGTAMLTAAQTAPAAGQSATQPGSAPVEPPVASQRAVVEPVPPVRAVPVVASPPHHAEQAKAGSAQLAKADVALTKSGKDSRGRAKSARDKAAAAVAADGPDKDKTPDKDKSGATDKSTAKGKGAKGKGDKGRAAAKDVDVDADAEPALEPCKPALTAKGRKGKAAAKTESTRSVKAKSAHGTLHNAKGKKRAPDDSETCLPAVKGDRPDGPGGVSRDSESDDSRPSKSGDGKSRDGKSGDGKDHDKTKSKNRDKEGEKATEKGGRKAHYASRIWVQVLTAGDRDKMAGEWRAMVRKAHGLKGRKPYLTPWHSNFRLLTGPFDSDAEAQDFIAELRKDGVSGFEWTSPAGQAIDSLGS